MFPETPEPSLARARALHDAGRGAEAFAAYLAVIQRQPESAAAHHALGRFLLERGQFEPAADALVSAVRLEPRSAAALADLAKAQKQTGRWAEALAALRRAHALEPDSSELHGAIIDNLHYQPTSSPDTIRAEQAAWNQRHALPLRATWRPHDNDRDATRRLRIGYVSASFRTHADASFLLALLEEHDPASVEVHCYATVRQPDALTERMQRTRVVWHDVKELTDGELAQKIRGDAIDIALDLNMHWAGGRLGTFSRRPAPVQVSWLAFADDAGLDFFDHRVSDALLDPPDADATGHIVRLPATWGCFRPISAYPEITPLPASRAGGIAFGSLNGFYKINAAVLRCWTRVLAAVPASTLLLECPEGAVRARVQRFFAADGIAPDRIAFAGRKPLQDYRRLYHEIDVGLDPFPYNGCATTCDALWMGVPVVTLAGTTLVARAGLSLLTNAGLPELVACDEDDYVRIAARLATDRPRLAALRAGLRTRLLASPLMDGPRFARDMESAYRAMWRRWCAS